MNAQQAEGPHSRLSRTTMLVLAVTLHNIPEGMAVGAIYAGWLSGSEGITLGAALALSLGIAIQNFPEGAIISMGRLSLPISSSFLTRMGEKGLRMLAKYFIASL